jgi:hypothetical protein
VILVNAQHMKAIPGRKTDIKDSEWLADLLRHGLLKASFIPPAPVRELRDLVFVNDIGGQFLIRIGARDFFECVTDNQIWGPCDNEKGNHLAFC